MGFSPQVYEKAKNMIKARRQGAEDTAAANRAEIYRRIPEIREMDRLIASTAIAVAKLAVTGHADDEKLAVVTKKAASLQAERKALLAEAGLPGDFDEERYFCKKCNDKGYVGAKMCGCLKSAVRNVAYEEISKGSNLRLCGFDNFSLAYYPDTFDEKLGGSPKQVMEDNLAFLKAYCDQFSAGSRSICLHGQTGLGKTHLSLAAAKKVIDRGFGVIYGTTQGFINKIDRERFTPEKYTTLDLICDCDLLILDDLGAEFESGWNANTVYQIIDTRMLKQQPTILSTNLTMGEISRRYTPRLMSRLLECYEFLPFVGSDIRQMKRGE